MSRRMTKRNDLRQRKPCVEHRPATARNEMTRQVFGALLVGVPLSRLALQDPTSTFLCRCTPNWPAGASSRRSLR